MNVLIIEDEPLAGKRLIDLIKQYDDSIKVLGRIGTVKKSVEWFNNNCADLVFMDIQLADGLSFEIFEQTTVDCPVIFTTAFDEYAIKAFKVNSIDYLLKPIDFEELSSAIDKFKISHEKQEIVPTNYSKIEEALHSLTTTYKTRFVIKVGVHIRPVEVDDIQYFYSFDKATFLQTNENKSYALDLSLDQIERLINPQQFFRINRKFLVNIKSIDEVVSFSKSRLKIKFKHSKEQEAIVSRDKASAFKEWLE
jgi:DNA-binding LytR/AlgR family response regulator